MWLLKRILRRTLAVVVFLALAGFLIQDASYTVMDWQVLPLPVRALLLLASDIACFATAACAALRACRYPPERWKPLVPASVAFALCLSLPICVVGMALCEPGTRAYCALIQAIQAQDADAVRAQLARGVDPNITLSGSVMPLNTAVYTGDLAVLDALLESGANIEAEDHWGSTPLDTAAESGKLEMIRLLIRRGAKVNNLPDGSSTALEAARRTGHSDSARLLRTYGAR